MWRLWILCVACGGGTSAPIPQPVAAAVVPMANPDALPVPTNQMLARVSYQNTNTWIDIAIDGTGSNARSWCQEMVNRFVQCRVDPLKPVVVRACEATRLPQPQRRGFAIRLTAPLDILELAMIGAGSAPEPPTESTTHVSQFDTLAACERDRVRVADERSKASADADAAMRAFIDGQLELVEQAGVRQGGRGEEGSVSRRREDVRGAPQDARPSVRSRAVHGRDLEEKEGRAFSPAGRVPTCLELR